MRSQSPPRAPGARRRRGLASGLAARGGDARSAPSFGRARPPRTPPPGPERGAARPCLSASEADAGTSPPASKGRSGSSVAATGIAFGGKARRSARLLTPRRAGPHPCSSEPRPSGPETAVPQRPRRPELAARGQAMPLAAARDLSRAKEAGREGTPDAPDPAWIGSERKGAGPAEAPPSALSRRAFLVLLVLAQRGRARGGSTAQRARQKGPGQRCQWCSDWLRRKRRAQKEAPIKTLGS